MDRVRWTVLHAVRLLTVTARDGYVDLSEAVARLPIQPAHAGVCFRARLLAVVAADAQRFVDDQNIGRFAKSFIHQEVHDRAGLGSHFHDGVVDDASARVLLQMLEVRTTEFHEGQKLGSFHFDGF